MLQKIGQTCIDCSYFRLWSGHTNGSCIRFPKEEIKHENDWCGEYEKVKI